MRVGGLGAGHGSDMHHITNCVHSHNVSKKKEVGAAASQLSQAPSENKPIIAEYKPESGISLVDWLKNTVSEVRKLWGRIWGSDTDSEGELVSTVLKEHVSGLEQGTLRTEEEQDTVTLQENALSQDANQAPEKEIEMIEAGVLQTAHVAAASEAVPPPQTIANNSYFAAVEDTGRQQQAVWQKIRVRFQEIAGYLSRHFSFSNRNSFQAKQEQPKEDMSRRSRYRKDELEFDCVITDESYLMDSYNKRGEYSKLAEESIRKSKNDVFL